MGYIVMSAKLRRQGNYYERPEFFAPLSYGIGDEPSPEQLLRRGRATLFASRSEASAAIHATIKAATEEGATWPKKYGIYLIEVENAPSNARVQALKQALEALEYYLVFDTVEEAHLFETVTVPEAIAALRQAIKEAEEAELKKLTSLCDFL
jgi:hypothetical protein